MFICTIFNCLYHQHIFESPFYFTYIISKKCYGIFLKKLPQIISYQKKCSMFVGLQELNVLILFFLGQILILYSVKCLFAKNFSCTKLYFYVLSTVAFIEVSHSSEDQPTCKWAAKIRLTIHRPPSQTPRFQPLV